MTIHGGLFMRYYMKGNAKCEQPSLLVFVSTAGMAEADQQVSRRQWEHLRCGVATAVRWDGTNASRAASLQFGDASTFWQWIGERLQPKKVTWVFSRHWHYHATLLDLWGMIESGFFKLHRVSKDGRCRCNSNEKGSKCWRGTVAVDRIPWLVTVDSQYGRANFVDILNYSRESYHQLGRDCSLFELDRPPADAPQSAWFAYLERQVSIIQRFTTGLMAEWRRADAGNWKMTAAALSYTNWAHKFKPKSMVIDTDKEARELERSSYYGGQITSWYGGEVCDHSDPVAAAVHDKLDLRTHTLWEPVYQVDVASLYPSVMRGKRYPCELRGVLRFPTVDNLRELVSDYLCIADVRLRAIHEGYPYRSGNVLTFPEGMYNTTLAHPELVRALDRGQILAVNRVAFYRHDDLFTKFVDHWWAKRKRAMASGNVTRDRLCKMMMNTLFGKFGQRKSVWRQRPDCHPPEPWTLWPGPRLNGRGIVKHRAIGWQDYELACEEYTDQAFPAVSACVTSYAREYMRAIRQHLPAYSCLYQHTDMLIVTGKGLAILNDLGVIGQNQLGLFQPPVKITHAVIRGANNITVDQVDHVSGVGKGAYNTANGRWLVDRMEPFSHLFVRDPDGTIATDKQELSKPPIHVGMHEWTPGWWTYSPLGL